jgi:hypothetical protein
MINGHQGMTVGQVADPQRQIGCWPLVRPGFGCPYITITQSQSNSNIPQHQILPFSQSPSSSPVARFGLDWDGLTGGTQGLVGGGGVKVMALL